MIVWLFLNRSSHSFTIFCRLSSVSICRMIFVFVFPCNPISSLSSQSSPNKGWVFLFSVISMGSVILFFSRYHFNHSLALELYRIFIHIYKAFCGSVYFRCINYRRYYRYWEPVSMTNSIGCPWTNSIAL